MFVMGVFVGNKRKSVLGFCGYSFGFSPTKSVAKISRLCLFANELTYLCFSICFLYKPICAFKSYFVATILDFEISGYETSRPHKSSQCCLISSLRGGVKIENRENLGQCPNRGGGVKKPQKCPNFNYLIV